MPSFFEEKQEEEEKIKMPWRASGAFDLAVREEPGGRGEKKGVKYSRGD